jgi:predicted  nucleic acid-binding Zn-ribbon protein
VNNEEKIIGLLEKMNYRMSAMEDRMSAMEDRMSAMENRMSAIENEMLSMKGEISSLKDEVSTVKDRQMKDGEVLELTAAQVSTLTKDMTEVKSRLASLENAVTRIEHDHGKKLQALFDGYQQHTDQLDRIEKIVTKHDELLCLREDEAATEYQLSDTP